MQATQVQNYAKHVNGSLALITQLVSWFISPGWTTWRALWFDSTLKILWTLVANICYIIFAAVLVVIAIMNIFWKWWEWELKQALPRFIIGLLMVPLSWLIVGAIVSFSSVLTANILTFPMTEFEWAYESLWKTEFYTEYTFNIWKSAWKTKEPIERHHKISFKEFLKKDKWIFWIFNVYTYWVMRVDSQWSTTVDDIKKWWIKSLMHMWVKAVFDAIFMLAYIILMVAILIWLFVRWVLLWLFMIFSPVFWLFYYFNGKTVKAPTGFSFMNFLWLAMMPVYVAWALAFGLLFIMVAWKTMNSSGWKCDESTTICIKNEWNTSTVKYLWITLKFKWAFSGSHDSKLKEVLWGFKWAFWLLVLQMLWLVIMWVWVLAALSTHKITRQAVAPIKQFGQSIWKIAIQAPSYLPIIPSPGWWMILVSLVPYCQIASGPFLCRFHPFSYFSGWRCTGNGIWPYSA